MKAFLTLPHPPTAPDKGWSCPEAASHRPPQQWTPTSAGHHNEPPLHTNFSYPSHPAERPQAPNIASAQSEASHAAQRGLWAALPPGTRVVSLLLCTPSAGPRAPACTRSLQGHWPQAQGAAAAAAAAAAGSAEVEVLMMTMGVMAGRAAIAAEPDVTRVTSALSATSTHRGTQRSWGLPNQDSSILCFVHRI